MGMTTHEAAQKITDALNASGEYTAKTWTKGALCRVQISDERDYIGHIEIGARRPFDTVTKHTGHISLIAERTVKLTGSRAEDLEVVTLPETPAVPAYPRDENEAQAREDGESWIDQYGRRNRPGT